MKTIFKAGDRVFDIHFGWGMIKFILSENTSYPVLVQFNTMDIRYTLDGKKSTHHTSSSLSFTEYTLQGFSQERPKKEPKIGSLCLFSNDKESLNNNIGYVGIFSGKTEGGVYRVKNGGVLKYCKQIEIKEV